MGAADIVLDQSAVLYSLAHHGQSIGTYCQFVMNNGVCIAISDQLRQRADISVPTTDTISRLISVGDAGVLRIGNHTQPYRCGESMCVVPYSSGTIRRL